jgi:PGM1 C-terminal domain
MRAERPGLEHVLLKLNEGVSGEGNAKVDLQGIVEPGSPDEAGAIEERVRGMSFETDTTFDRYIAKLGATGGVVEELIAGDEFRSPSVQLRVTPLGRVELLSTHDQLLGGPSGQTYIGCRFPADAGYAARITAEAAKIGARLAGEGVIGRFALDFVTVRRNGSWDPYAIELNLRKGGTTHPFLTLQFLTDGTYDPERAVFTAPSGQEKHFVASDHVENPAYRDLTPDDLFDIAARRGLHFYAARQTGVVFHMLAALAEEGWMGLTAVGDSAPDADRVYREAIAVLDEEAADPT